MQDGGQHKSIPAPPPGVGKKNLHCHLSQLARLGKFVRGGAKSSPR